MILQILAMMLVDLLFVILSLILGQRIYFAFVLTGYPLNHIEYAEPET